MMTSPPPTGLAALSDEQLKQALRALTQGKLPCPFKRSDLLLRGLNPLAEHGDLLFGLDARGVRAALVSALSERRQASAREEKLKRVIEHLHREIEALSSSEGEHNET